MWETLAEIGISGQWQYTDPTENNIFRFTLTQPFNLSGIAIAQAETGVTPQLFDIQRLAIRPEAEICVIAKPVFFSDRRLAVRGIPFASNKSVSGTLKIEGMSMAISQVHSGFSSGWTREGNQLISPSQELILSCSNESFQAKVFQLIPEGCILRVDELQYAFKANGQGLPSTTTAILKLKYYPVQGQTLNGVISQSIFGNQSFSSNDTSENKGYELGTRFISSENGEITHVRFHKAVGETGTHVGRIWSNNGDLLASATFTNETASGWQQQALETPLAISANTPYVVSYNTSGYFTFALSGLSSPVSNGYLSTVAPSNELGGNGIFNVTPGSFPSQSFNSANYFADVKASYVPGDNFTLEYLNQNVPISSLRHSYGSIAVPDSANLGRPSYGLMSAEIALQLQDNTALLEGCSVLKYRLIWS